MHAAYRSPPLASCGFLPPTAIVVPAFAAGARIADTDSGVGVAASSIKADRIFGPLHTTAENMDEIAKVLLGASVGFIAASLGERIKRVQASRAVALMLLRELEYHRCRLSLAASYDQIEETQYELQFPSPIWTANASTFVAGAPLREGEALLNWYASTSILGNRLARRIGPDGPELIGPDRSRLAAALADAHEAAQRVAVRGNLWRKQMLSPSLFEEAAR